MAQAERAIRTATGAWLDGTVEEIEWCHLMCLVPTVCPCNDDAWALVNDYPHTTAECECPCHERAGKDGS